MESLIRRVTTIRESAYGHVQGVTPLCRLLKKHADQGKEAVDEKRSVAVPDGPEDVLEDEIEND